MKIVFFVAAFFLADCSRADESLKVFVQDMDIAPYSRVAPGLVKGAVNPAIFGLLLRTSQSGDLLPGFVKKWTYSFKSNVYTLTLDRVKFHNGREINARDFEFSIARCFLDKNNGFTRFFFSEIEGVEKLVPGDSFRSGNISGFQIVDDKTVRIKLRKFSPNFLYRFSLPFIELVPMEELVEKDYFIWKSKPVGAGPYKVVKDYANRELILEKVDRSKSRAPLKIIIHNKRFFPKYDLLFENVDPSASEAGFSLNVAESPSGVVSVFFVNKSKLSNDINFRKAIHHGVDRESAILSSNQLKPATRLLLRTRGGGLIDSFEKNPFDPELAKRFLSKVPRKFLKNPVRVAVYSPDNKSFPNVISNQILEIKKQLLSIGLNVEFVASPENIMTKEMVNDFDMRISTRLADWFDPMMIFATLVKDSPYVVETPMNNGMLNHLFDLADREKTSEGAFRGLKKMSYVISENLFVVPLFQRHTLFRVNPVSVKSLGSQPRPHYLDMSLIEMN